MRAVKKWRYYCDFCKKSGASKYHMANHEKRCTLNPERTCRFCDFIGEEQPYIEDLLTAIYEDYNCDYEKNMGSGYWNKAKLNNVRKVTECPACILSAIRQFQVIEGLFGEWDFNYKETAKDIFQEFNDSEARY